jgi:tetratricopeptide (TPR) repeat protein/TolB-like protein
VLYSVVHEEPEPLGALRHDVPQKLEAIIDRCMKKDPGERFTGAADLAAALEPLRNGRATGSSLIEIGSTTSIPIEPARRHGLLVAAAVLVLACVGLFAMPQSRSVVRGWFGGGRPPKQNQLAVLPFQNDGDSSDAAFVDGLRRHLTLRLSQLERFEPSLLVIPAAELDTHDVETPKEALGISGATLALKGTVERRGDDISLMLDLVDTRSDSSVDSRPWQNTLANIAACQQGPVGVTTDMLGLIPEGPSLQVLSKGCTTVPGALEPYLAGLGRLWDTEDDSTDHIADAVSLFTEALALDPSFAQAYVGLGQAHWRDSDDPEYSRKAAESAQAAIQLDDRLAAAHVILGLIETRDEKYPEAAREFTRALEIDPVNYSAHLGLAVASLEDGDPDMAERTYQEAIAARRKHWAPHYNLGRFYCLEGRYDEAVPVLNTASDLAPDNPWPYIAIGASYFYSDRFDEATVTWERALALEPPPEACRMVYGNLGTCYFAQSLHADAIGMYEMALEEDESNYITWGNMAAAYDVMPDGDEKAVEHYTRASELAEEELRLTPRDEQILASLAVYSAELGDSARAQGYLVRTMELLPEDNRVMFDVGQAHEVLGRRNIAVDWIVRAVESGFSRGQVETTPGLRDLCAGDRYQRLIRRGEDR